MVKNQVEAIWSTFIVHKKKRHNIWFSFPGKIANISIFKILSPSNCHLKNSKIRTSFNAKNHHQNQRHFGAPSIDFSWHIRISGLPDSLGNIFIKWKIFLNLFQKNLFLQKKIFGWDTARPKWLPVGQPNLTLSRLDFTILVNLLSKIWSSNIWSTSDDHLINFWWPKDQAQYKRGSSLVQTGSQ